MQKSFFITLLVVLRLCGYGNVIEIPDYKGISFSFGEHCEYLETQETSLDKIILPGQQWQRLLESNPNFFVKDNYIWIRFKLTSNSQRDDLFLSILNSSIDDLAVFQTSNVFGRFDSTVINSWTPNDEKEVRAPYSIVKLKCEAERVNDVFIRLKNGDQMLVPLLIQDSEELNCSLGLHELTFWIYSGLLLAIFLMNLFIAANTKERSYWIYILYIVLLYCTQAHFQGYSLKELVSIEYVEKNLVFWLSGAVGIVAGFFMRNFLSLSNSTFRFNSSFAAAILLYIASAILASIGKAQVAYVVLQLTASVWATYMLAVSYILWKQGSKQAFHFFLAWCSFLVSVIVFALKDYSIFEYNYFTSHSMIFGSAVEGVLLSIALADKINQFKREKELSQERMIAVMQENQTLIERQNMELEQMVTVRTYDLAVANKELSQTLNDLKLTQKQLLESEKLASLGQMTAGIAHEINNPINFVSSNIQPLKRDVADLLELLDGYTSATDLDELAARLPELQLRYRELDIDFLRHEIAQLLAGIEEGSRRTTEIVKGLRIFSRMDHDTLVSANINECLNSTLMVMKNVTRGEVHLTKELEAGLPGIDCFPGKLNQVFMNILNNAVQSTQITGRKPEDRHVGLYTWHDHDHVYIRITDNGVGITEEVRSRIFDPFFTTKPVGEGTGLGLSIALGIVREHNGSIQVFSEEGKGAEFLVTLPRRLASAETPLAA
jgi:two-component system, NtrC family, sensor kinase